VIVAARGLKSDIDRAKHSQPGSGASKQRLGWTVVRVPSTPRLGYSELAWVMPQNQAASYCVSQSQCALRQVPARPPAFGAGRGVILS
jgi:hypothetical protein